MHTSYNEIFVLQLQRVVDGQPEKNFIGGQIFRNNANQFFYSDYAVIYLSTDMLQYGGTYYY